MFKIGDKVKIKNTSIKMTGVIIKILEEDQNLGGNLTNPHLYKGTCQVKLDNSDLEPQYYEPSLLELKKD